MYKRQVLDAPPRDDRQAVQHDLLEGHHRAHLPIPVRLAVGALDQVRRELLGPFRLDPRVHPGPEAAGLDELGGHHPFRLPLEEHRPGEDREFRAAGAQILPLLRILETDVAEKTREQGGVHRLRRDSGFPVLFQSQIEGTDDRPQLRVDVLPFTDSQVVQELGTAEPAELVPGQLLLFLPQIAPQVQVREEVRFLVHEPGVLLVGLLLFLGRALARVLDRQRGRDHHHLGDTFLLVRLDDHAGQARVDRELGELAAHRGELAGGERAELLEQLDAVGDVALVRWVDERELRQVAEAQVGHLQDDRGEVRPQDLRLGELRAALEVLLRVETDADAVGGTPAAPLPLVRAGLRDRLDRKSLHLEAVRVPADPGGAGVDHVADAGHGQRRLGDVRGQHDATGRVTFEDLVLLRRGEPPVERDDLGAAQVLLLQRVRGVPDVPLAGEEDQDVAVGGQLVDRGRDALGLVDRLFPDLVVVDDRGGDQGAVADLHRERPAGHLDDRRRLAGRVGEVLGEALRLDRRRGDDQLEVGPPGQQVPQVAEDEVDVEAALVRLVDDQRVVAPQHPVGLDLGQQDAVGHHLDQRVVAGLVGEPDLVADRGAERPVQLLGDALGDRARGDPAGLGVPDLGAHAAAQLQADLRDLGGLAGAGLAGHDHDLVVADRGGDVVLAGADRQGLRVRDRGHGGRPALPARLGRLDLSGDRGEGGGLRVVVPDPSGAFEAAAEPVFVTGKELGDPAAEL